MLEALTGRINTGPPPPGPGAWTALPSGAVSYLGRAVGFGDSVFIFGGRSPSNPTNAIRKYNTVTKAWSTVGTLPWTAESSVAVVIGNLIYVHAGGSGSTRFGNLVSFNPATNAVVTLAAGMAVTAASAVAMDGKMYVFGGNTTVTNNTLRCYDPAINSWSTLSPAGTLPASRYYHDAVTSGGKMYVVSGGSYTTSLTWIKALDVYDLATNTWEPSIPLTFGLYAYAIGIVGRKIYVAGGVEEANGGTYVATTRIYDLDTKGWTIAQPQFKKLSYQQSGVADGKLYCFGGFDIGTGGPVADSLLYTPS